MPLPIHLKPDLSGSVDLEVLVVYPLYVAFQFHVTPDTGGKPFRNSPAGPVLAVQRRGDQQLRADRLAPEFGPIILDEVHHHFGLRPSSTWAERSVALRIISLSRFSSRFSRLSSCSSALSVVSSVLRALRHHAQPGQPYSSASPTCNSTSPRPNRSSPTVNHAPFRSPEPVELHVLLLNTYFVFPDSLLSNSVSGKFEAVYLYPAVALTMEGIRTVHCYGSILPIDKKRVARSF